MIFPARCFLLIVLHGVVLVDRGQCMPLEVTSLCFI
jgi:hypothetical protein